MFKFLTNRPFWVNLLVAVFLAFLIVFIFLQLLGVITKHGEYLTVPAVTGKKTAEAVKFLEDKGFEVMIQDSVYTDTADMGIVLKQLPDPNSTVKVNRTVFLTINRVTLPLVEMPALEGKTLNFALTILTRSHLTLGDTVYKPHYMRGSVLSQSYKGDIIKSGTKIPWGSGIDLVIGSGLGEEKILVPSLIGLTVEEAKMVLDQSGIEIGALIPGDNIPISDTAAAYIDQQRPPRLNQDKEPVFIQPGQLMDLWITKDKKSQTDSTNVE